MTDARSAQRNDHEAEKKSRDASGEAEADKAKTGNDSAPENQFARAETVQEKSDRGTDNARLQLAQRHGRGNHPAVPAEGSLYGKNENTETLKIGGGKDRVGEDTRDDHIPAEKNSPRL